MHKEFMAEAQGQAVSAKDGAGAAIAPDAWEAPLGARAAQQAAGACTQQSAALLAALQTRVDTLGAQEASFVLSVLARTALVPKPLADLIVGMLVRTRPVRLEPVHHALADLVSHTQGKLERPVSLGHEGLALIRACQRDRAANGALDFILALPSVLSEVGWRIQDSAAPVV